MPSIAIDRHASTTRIAADVQALSHPPYTEAGPGITRHAFTEAYARTQEYLRVAFEQVGFDVWCDPVGNLVASNVAEGALCFGLGSHCDSVDHGGAYDGVLGLACALGVCRLAREQRVDLPLRVISFLEEEGAGFGQLLLGSRLAANAVEDEQLATFADTDGRSFVDAARSAGLDPEHHRQAAVTLDGLTGWIEVHIEQGRVQESERVDLGLVAAIAGYIHADLEIVGRTDHAGATPMRLRSDAAITAAELVVGLEALARQSSSDTVATVGDLRLLPGTINVIAGTARMTLDMRSVSGNHVNGG
jgi:hydantoinase/carbamoylase family amidase